ncbi:uncharacterized protein N7482_002527 [Penicillium canariense]|uniref:Uncharacterized protein n=1 Tax=Penicillium canariense TaxID=189055 RepID=A0A9W9IIY0_9EURO|nr:uncharacterized protein N7482_002527 [Penicillium canariense]KAJ5176650.1 hypothetical protein N7482_002527 [Penicillium canariense]
MEAGQPPVAAPMETARTPLIAMATPRPRVESDIGAPIGTAPPGAVFMSWTLITPREWSPPNSTAQSCPPVTPVTPVTSVTPDPVFSVLRTRLRYGDTELGVSTLNMMHPDPPSPPLARVFPQPAQPAPSIVLRTIAPKGSQTPNGTHSTQWQTPEPSCTQWRPAARRRASCRCLDCSNGWRYAAVLVNTEAGSVKQASWAEDLRMAGGWELVAGLLESSTRLRRWITEHAYTRRGKKGARARRRLAWLALVLGLVAIANSHVLAG